MAAISWPAEASEGLIFSPTVRAAETKHRHLFVVPAYNEAANLPRLFADFEARQSLFPEGSRIIIVDDGSDDATAELAEAHAGSIVVEVVRMGTNQGPGAAFRAGFQAALAHCGPNEEAFVITLEADTTNDLDALPEMIRVAAAGADVVLAAWQMKNVSARRRLLSRGAGFVVRHLLGVDAHTVSSFYRVYRTSALRLASERYGAKLIRESGFACKAELLAKLCALDMQVAEVRVDLDTTRRVGESKMPVGKTIVAYWRMLVRHVVLGAAEAS